MKKSLILIILAALIQSNYAQKLVSRNSYIWFTASTPLEDIVAHNRQAVSILDPANGSIAFNLLVKSFEFKVALMQEHFNENYLESDKYPKSTFQGKINNNADIDYKKNGTYKAEVSGDLSIHNVTRPVTATGTVDVKDGVVTARSQFIVKPVDYNITIPSVVENKIAKEVEINIEARYNEN